MLKFLMIALMTCVTVPAFSSTSEVDANTGDEVMTTEDSGVFTQEQFRTEIGEDEQTFLESLTTQAEDEGMEQFHHRRPRHPHWRPWTCFSRDIFHRTFWARAHDWRRAAHISMWACRHHNPVGQTCRFLGCRR